MTAGSFSQSSSVESHCGPGEVVRPARGLLVNFNRHDRVSQTSSAQTPSYRPVALVSDENPNRFRLERFGKAMTGTGSWEAPGAIFNGKLLALFSFQVLIDASICAGFDWHALPKNSIVVDVGGGIGSTSMLLASAFSEGDGVLGLKFIVQDRPVVVEIGERVSSLLVLILSADNLNIGLASRMSCTFGK